MVARGAAMLADRRERIDQALSLIDAGLASERPEAVGGMAALAEVVGTAPMFADLAAFEAFLHGDEPLRF